MFSDLICAKDGVDYCVVKNGGLSSSMSSMGPTGPTREMLTQMCSPCAMTQFKIFARILGMMAQSDEGNLEDDEDDVVSGMMAQSDEGNLEDGNLEDDEDDVEVDDDDDDDMDEDKDDEVQVAAALSKREAGVVPKDQQKSFQSMTSMIKGMCATDKDESFCALQPNIMIMMTQNNPAMTPPPGTSGKNYAAMCSFCGRKIMGSYLGLNPDRSERKKMSDQMVQSCFKKEDMDKFCGDFVGESSLVFANHIYMSIVNIWF
jgi:hypothetical protein